MGASRCLECGQVFFSAKIRVGRCAPCRLKAAGGIVPAGATPGQPGLPRPGTPMARPGAPGSRPGSPVSRLVPRPVTSAPNRNR
jgi:hypothetical protein